MNRKRILITGGAGAVGLETLRELVKSPGYIDLRVLDLPNKRTRRALAPFANRIRYIPGSVDNKEIVDEAVRGVDTVIHLAAIIPPEADSNPMRTGRTNVWGTHLLIDAVKRLAPDAFFLYASSISVYGDRLETPWIVVNDPLRPSEGDIYAAGKITAERLIRRSGLRHSIFRLTAVMSPSVARGGHIDPLMFHMPLDTSLEVASSRDVGFALSRAVHHETELDGKIFNLGGGPACRLKYRDFLRRTFNALGLDFDKIDETAFATRNFHCGFYADSCELQSLLHFQRDSAESCIEWISDSVPRWKHFFTGMAKSAIERFLLEKSDPRNALKQGNRVLIERFFGNQRPLAGC